MRYTPVLILLCWVGLLSSLSLEYPSGNIYELDYEDYPEAKLQSIVSKRSSEGGMETETWLGLSLKSLLEEAGETDWDLACIKSKDNYETIVNRVELKGDSAFLALYKNGLRLSDYDVRIIFPAGHESSWIRNLQSIEMEPLHSLPPLQIRSLELLPLMVHPESSAAGISMADLVTRGMRLSAAEIVIISKDFRKTRYAYPSKQHKLYLEQGAQGEYFLREEGQDKAAEPHEAIMYLQCGNIGFIRSSAAQRLPEIALALDWDWLLLGKRLIQGEGIAVEDKDLNLEAQRGAMWLELK